MRMDLSVKTGSHKYNLISKISVIWIKIQAWIKIAINLILFRCSKNLLVNFRLCRIFDSKYFGTEIYAWYIFRYQEMVYFLVPKNIHFILVAKNVHGSFSVPKNLHGSFFGDWKVIEKCVTENPTAEKSTGIFRWKKRHIYCNVDQ